MLCTAERKQNRAQARAGFERARSGGDVRIDKAKHLISETIRGCRAAHVVVEQRRVGKNLSECDRNDLLWDPADNGARSVFLDGTRKTLHRGALHLPLAFFFITHQVETHWLPQGRYQREVDVGGGSL